MAHDHAIRWDYIPICLQDTWFNTMFSLWLAKTESLKKSLHVLRQTHARRLDRKNAMLQTLKRDMTEAETQYQTAVQAHFINLDALIDMQMSRLTKMENQFEKNLELLEGEFNTEKYVVCPRMAHPNFIFLCVEF